MKKLINSMLSMLAIAGVLFLASCGDDEEDPAPNGPTVGLVNSTGNISGDADLLVGSSFSIEVTASKGDRNMDTWSILRDGVALANFDELDVPENDNFTTVVSDIPVPADAGAYTYTFQVTDRDGVTGSVEWVITAVVPASFTTFTETLGAQSSATGSSIDVSEERVYNLGDAKANSDKVDFFYYYGSTNQATLWSPTDSEANADDIFGLANEWATKNATAISTSTLDFDNATPADVVAATISGTRANNLSSDDVVIFETVDGVRGIGKVSITGAADGEISIDFKVIK
jgi:hypothetical protein